MQLRRTDPCRSTGSASQEADADELNVALPGGRTLHVLRRPGSPGACPASRAPLVLLHGLLDDAEGWKALAARSHRPSYAVDLPGFGGSSPPLRPRIDAYADDVLAGLQALGVEGAILVGHSLGGGIATLVAERAAAAPGPRVVEALILLAPVGFGTNRFAELGALPGVLDVTEAMLPFSLANPLVVTAAYTAMVAHLRPPSLDVVQRLRRRAFCSAHGTRVALEALAALSRAADAPHRRRVAFDGPVTAIWGARDGLVLPGHATALRRALPQAQVEVWKGMGHHPQRERPTQLHDAVERAAWAAHVGAGGRDTRPLRRAA